MSNRVKSSAEIAEAIVRKFRDENLTDDELRELIAEAIDEACELHR